MLAGELDQLAAVVVAGLLEQVRGRWAVRRVWPYPLALPRVTVEVKPVASRRDLTRFIKLPWRLYRNEPNWVPPLVSERRDFLDRHKNPFFEHAEAEFFLAWRDGEPVGRISAHVDRHFNEFQGNDWGLFGFFECEDDPEVAGALLDAAAGVAARPRPRPDGRARWTSPPTTSAACWSRATSASR